MDLLTRHSRVLVCLVTCLGFLATGHAAAADTAGPEAGRVEHDPSPGPHRALAAGNLLLNPGAEDGVGGGLPSWDTTPGFVGELYGSEFRPGLQVSEAIDGGAGLFAGGSEADTSSASQVVDVSSAAREIDAGAVSAHLRAYLGGIDDEGDYAQVSLAFLPADGDQPVTPPVYLGPVTAADRGFVTSLLPRSAERVVPATTRRILVTITATRFVGIYTDGYADNLSLTLSPHTVSVTTHIQNLRARGGTVYGEIRATSPCRARRTLVVKKNGSVLGTSKSRASGSFTVPTRKHKQGKLVVSVQSRRTETTVCTAVSREVPGRH